jgi:hypothetical protein
MDKKFRLDRCELVASRKVLNCLKEQQVAFLITVKCKMPNRLGRTVTDKGKKMCVDPEGNGVTMNEGAEGGPARLAQSKISSQLATVEAARRSWGGRKNRRMGSVRHQDLIMHRVCIVVYINLL